MTSVIRPIELEAVKAQFDSAAPFRFFVIDDFLEPEFAKRVAEAYPTFACARRLGHEFDAVNEKLKIQITEREKFPAPVRTLADALSQEDFLGALEQITGIPRLVSDPLLAGGGIHVTGPTGRLDVHVDFNYIRERQLHRRLNILVYLNPEWQDSWGGFVELWDKDVKNCHHSFMPQFNRCVVFETSEISFHGVTRVTCPVDQQRMSFAAYYYTHEAPEGWDGREHSTVFRARPNEHLKSRILMPAEALQRNLMALTRKAKRTVKSLIDRT